MKIKKDNRSLRPYIATILNYIKGLRTADTLVDEYNPYILYIPINRDANTSYVFEESVKRLRNSNLSGTLTIEPSQLIVKVDRYDSKELKNNEQQIV